MDKLTVSIVIPVYKHYDLTHALLFDIYQYNRDADEILVVNDGVRDEETYKGVAWWREHMLSQVRLLDIEGNKGFLKACNIGVKKATGDIIILISNDVRFQDDVVNLVRSVLSSDSKILMGGKLYTGSTGWNEFKNGKKNRIFSYMEGWLLIFTKTAWEELGGFDERFSPNDYEDIDISTTAISKGYTLTPLSSDKIRHIGAQSIGYTPERLEITRRNRKLFAEKWGVGYYDV